MAKTMKLKLDRAARTSLADQIRLGITAAIGAGVLVPGARLPSWLALAAQLGVARGTVKRAYERLVDEQLIVSSRASGTRVARRPDARLVRDSTAPGDPQPAFYYRLSGPAMFQMGVPASDRFPVKLFARLRCRAARAEAAAPAIYPDPRGEPQLRREIAAHLALSRGVECRSSQVFIAAGFAGALGLILRVLRCEGRRAWMENPGFPLSRRALRMAQLSPAPVPVDEDGIDVAYGIQHARDAALALVTPGQQAPLGATLSLDRRMQLIEWATRAVAWIIEDDYLGELQLERRAAPALASLDSTGRVIYIGSFSKTISPALRLGFVVAPTELVPRFEEAMICLAPAPGPAVQWATAEFMRGGHYMRHLRRAKRIYASRGKALVAALASEGVAARLAGLAVVLPLPAGARDTVIAREAAAHQLAPSALSAWYDPSGVQRSGLLLGVSSVIDEQLAGACERLHHLIRKFS